MQSLHFWKKKSEKKIYLAFFQKTPFSYWMIFVCACVCVYTHNRNTVNICTKVIL